MTGNEVRALRSKAGLSRGDFGALLGLSKRAIIRWEQLRDAEIPKSRALQVEALAEHLNPWIP